MLADLLALLPASAKLIEEDLRISGGGAALAAAAPLMPRASANCRSVDGRGSVRPCSMLRTVLTAMLARRARSSCDSPDRWRYPRRSVPNNDDYSLASGCGCRSVS